MLADVIDHLVCPVCGTAIHLTGGAVRCARGHSFDVARQGYVNMLTRPAGTADTPAMVAARARFLEAGHYDPLARRLAAVCAGAAVIADAGAGTGHYLAAALGDDAVGIALDVSKHALKRAARAHPRIGAVVADVWRPLPIRDGVVDVLLNVFAPRNAEEFARVLRPGGALIVVTPGPGHLRPLVERLGLLTVDEDKDRRLEETLGGAFARTDEETEEITLSLGHDEVEAVVGMGPSAWHTDPEELAARIGELPDPVPVTAAFRITRWTTAS
ncbi:rRNA (guanine-N1)-methyltransferase [Microbispora rosea subsp. aerata]|nr:methyltransferase domain-containing protein [Microbispora rosea]GGO13372.1 rRNA (guanine-N1)-methyltransferase [Microbispora rosea subsp. aerata]GIH54036.1 rRNA (guanine-N1)-methyltransferase [Microbispora rosea subsp. aerata]GLJ85009.1 rRNA (guanine-N1)-methyltransferase [Microbispora rosea subsp. aerata]